ncbi:uncharacterized protein PgNI_04940 [Pyricularia grisea]|uniref:Uncharacterized protein n=1 Tax=Pyricularia grisea TaxID=148305 RepID=A0A6P8BC97_PYRGI|nr:uncharacterized protein PgNI_04940 [Pyricularia grisea]TLD13481.1 hypothetical protein PgNI_04940 [Pyricularia grisea]
MIRYLPRFDVPGKSSRTAKPSGYPCHFSVIGREMILREILAAGEEASKGLLTHGFN